MLKFDLLKTEGLARDAAATLNHGVVETPIFMPVGTYGGHRVMPKSLEDMGTDHSGQHLPPVDAPWPGHHAAVRWTASVRSLEQTHPDRFRADSGLMSLGECARSAKTCALPRRVNSDKLFCDPEVSMQIQTILNSDIVMQFDECTPYRQPKRARPHHQRKEARVRWS